MMVGPCDVIVRPIITEKTNHQKEVYSQISFEVNKLANRIEIARAVESIFNVKVAKIRTMQVKGKVKRKGRIVGRRRSWKKAIVTLLPGESIEFFDAT